MSKAPKSKKAALHYQPYQAIGLSDEEQAMDLNVSELPLHLDPVLTGLSSAMSRNLWDDWNENDANFGMKFDMLPDEVSTASTASSTASPNPSFHVSGQQSMGMSADVSASHSVNSYSHMPASYEQQNAPPNAMRREEEPHRHDDAQKPRANVQRSLSEDIVSMLDDSNEGTFGKQMQGEQRREMGAQGGMFNPANASGMMGFQQPTMPMHPSQMQQFQQQQMQMMQMQQQLQQQQFQQPGGVAGNNWMNGFNAGSQTNRTPTAAASGNAGNEPVHRRHTPPTALEIAIAEGASSLTAMPHPATEQSGQPAPKSPAVPQPAGVKIASNDKSGAKTGASPGGNASKDKNSSGADTSGNADANAQANGFNPMMMPGFMMYPMPMMGNYPQGVNMMSMGMPGMPMGSMQMPMGMNMNGMQIPMQMQLQMQLQMQMAQMAQMNGIQMPMGLPGMQMNPMGMNMPQPVNPQSGLSGDVEMTSATPAAPVLKPAKPLQPKVAPRGPGFVNIARKPEEPEVSSILKALMDEEAKKKEKKLERNRDSARESRKKQQTYVETLENGIKRLQINRDLVRSYQWGVSGPGFGPLPCPNSPQMFDWKNRVEVVSGRTEAFANLQNPASFQSLMRLNRQRRTLAMQHGERELAVWKCFVFVGRQLAQLRTRVLQVQMLRTFSTNPLAMELDAVLKLTADQKLQLQCHAQQVFNEEVVQLTALFKVFFALRNEALRLNMLSPSLERYFRETCSFEQLQKLLQWSETQRSVIETDLTLDGV